MKNFLHALLGVLAGLLLAGILWWVALPPRGESVALQPPPGAPEIIVYVSGAIEFPGTYSLPAGSRVGDALEAAGGTTARADASRLNLAARLDDGEQVEVPEKVGQAQGQGSGSSSGNSVLSGPTPGAPSGSLVNINTATLEELDTLPGIGPATAQKIIEYRDANGPFQALEEIMNVPGIGPATFERIKDLITL
jgi:competence protein ComEA